MNKGPLRSVVSKIMSPSSGPVTYSPSSSVPEVETGSYHYYKMSIPQVDFVVMLVQYSLYQLRIIKRQNGSIMELQMRILLVLFSSFFLFASAIIEKLS